MRSIVRSGLIACAIWLAAAQAHAQYPAKPIRLIVPFAAGSTNDIVARFIAPPLSEALGRQVVIDNRAGAAGTIGTELAANSPPDGYTLVIGGIANAVSMSLFSKPGYDFARDFAPVSWLVSGSFMSNTCSRLCVALTWITSSLKSTISKYRSSTVPRKSSQT